MVTKRPMLELSCNVSLLINLPISGHEEANVGVVLHCVLAHQSVVVHGKDANIMSLIFANAKTLPHGGLTWMMKIDTDSFIDIECIYDDSSQHSMLYRK